MFEGEIVKMGFAPSFLDSPCIVTMMVRFTRWWGRPIPLWSLRPLESVVAPPGKI
jgi:hypothetical protein